MTPLALLLAALLYAAASVATAALVAALVRHREHQPHRDDHVSPDRTTP